MKPSIARQPLVALASAFTSAFTSTLASELRRGLGLSLSLLMPLAAQATPVAELHGLVVGGAAFSAGFYYSQSLSPATVGSNIAYSVSDTGTDGSYAHALFDVGFGSLHSYSDAHLVTVGGGAPQARASSEFVDYIRPGASSAVGYAFYTLTLAINGSHSATDPFGPRPGYTAQGAASYDIRDNRTGDVFAHGFFDSSDALPSTTLSVAISIPQLLMDDDIRIEVDLDTLAYVSNTDPAFQTAFADYSHTLVAHLDTATVGASTTGVSGFNYASPSTNGVPEPSTAALLLAGVFAAGAGARRVRSR